MNTLQSRGNKLCINHTSLRLHIKHDMGMSTEIVAMSFFTIATVDVWLIATWLCSLILKQTKQNSVSSIKTHTLHYGKFCILYYRILCTNNVMENL